jgi:hypothetical protein
MAEITIALYCPAPNQIIPPVGLGCVKGPFARGIDSIEHLHVTSSMMSSTVAAMLEVFFRTARDVLIEITLENS